MEGRESGRPASELLREHCQVFSRLGWALFLQLAVVILVQSVAANVAAAVAPALLVQPVFLWGLSVFSVYGAGFLALWLVLALRSCFRRKGGCGGDCAHCSRRCGQ